MKIKEVKAVYTGGNIWLFFGRLENGNWFMADDYGSVRIVNADPTADLDESLMEDWQLQHMVKDLFDRERQQFCSDMLDRLEQYEYGSDNNGGITSDEIKAYREYFREEI